MFVRVTYGNKVKCCLIMGEYLNTNRFVVSKESLKIFHSIFHTKQNIDVWMEGYLIWNSLLETRNFTSSD